VKIITLDLPLDRAEMLAEALYEHMNAWGSDMDEDHLNGLNSIYMALRLQINGK
jgi:hypothetical protein